LVTVVRSRDGGSGDGGGGSDDSGKGGEQSRSWEFTLSDHSVEFESEDPTTKTKLKFEIDENSDYEVALRFESKTGSDETESRIKIEVQDLIEFTDSNTIPGYQSGEAIVQTVSLDNINWNKIQCTGDATSTTWNCTSSTQDGQFTAVVHVVKAVIDVANVPVKPDSMKIDFIVNLKNRSNGTKIGMIVKFHAASKQDVQESDDSSEHKSGFVSHPEKEVSLGSAGFFSWEATAVANSGAVIAVVNTPLQDSQDENTDDDGSHEYKTVFSFDTLEGGPIVWDPKLGAGSGCSTLLVNAMLVVMAFALAAVF